MIKIKTYKLNNLVLTNDTLSVYINQFWNDTYSKLVSNNKNIHIMLLCKAHFTESSLGYRTLGNLRKVNFEDKALFLTFLTERLGILSDAYSVNSISKISFTYIIKTGVASPSDRLLLQDLTSKLVIPVHKFSNVNLPITMNPLDYGFVISKTVIDGITRYIINVQNKIYQIDVSSDNRVNTVTILGLSDFKWIDTKLSESGNYFKREIGKSTIYFKDGEIVLRKQLLSLKPIVKTTIDKLIKTYFVTMDIETVRDSSNNLKPYLICGYNGSEYIESFGKTQLELFSQFLNGLLKFFSKNGTNLIVYAHNLSGFDGIFLMKHLIKFGNVEPLIFNGRIISIKVTLTVNGYKGKTILFKDSYLLLPLSLRNLCRAFKVVIPKGYFPFKLSNIFYTGVFPKFEYWTGIPLTQWNIIKTEYGKRLWNFKDEAIKYCKLDCQSLHQVLTSFNQLIFNEFQINVHTVYTLPALAMRIFKTHYMKENTIYQLVGRVEEAIRQSYTGGHVDVYKPHNKIGDFLSKVYRKLYYYDVNSLYPAVMSHYLMPIGIPNYFEGDIRAVDHNAFGFFYCDITSPQYLEHPILLRRIETSEGTRTIAGLGSWSGWICSTEMDNAIKFGYTFKIIKGYEFETGDLFSTYVNKMYTLRQLYSKDHAMNLIAKLVMNSLYGKFGMKIEFTRVDLYSLSNSEDRVNLRKLLNILGSSVQDVIKFDNKVLIIRDSLVDNVACSATDSGGDIDPYHGVDVNIAIASTVTSNARVHMSIFKNNTEFNLYYTDTDSAIVDRPLPDNMVGSQLGQVKLEHVISKAVFLAPKVYGLVVEDGTEIIKVKGIRHEALNDVSVDTLSNLLIQDSSKVITQEKLYKNLEIGEISVRELAYTLKVTSNKRQPIYINGVLENTIPFYYDEIIKDSNI